MAIHPAASPRRPGRKRVRQQIKTFARAAYRQAILDAAEHTFSRLGYHQAKMSDVAAQAGVSIGTLYNHFRSKQLIFSSLVERGTEQLGSLVREAAAVPEFEQRLIRLVQTALSFIEQRGALFAVYVQLGGVSESDIARIYGKHAEQAYVEYLELLASTFEQAARAGKVRTDMSPRSLAAALSGSMNAAIFDWIRAGRSHGLTERADSILRLLLEGARPR